jgi:hypothetical protein
MTRIYNKVNRGFTFEQISVDVKNIQYDKVEILRNKMLYPEAFYVMRHPGPKHNTMTGYTPLGMVPEMTSYTKGWRKYYFKDLRELDDPTIPDALFECYEFDIAACAGGVMLVLSSRSSKYGLHCLNANILKKYDIATWYLQKLTNGEILAQMLEPDFPDRVHETLIQQYDYESTQYKLYTRYLLKNIPDAYRNKDPKSTASISTDLGGLKVGIPWGAKAGISFFKNNCPTEVKRRIEAGKNIFATDDSKKQGTSTIIAVDFLNKTFPDATNKILILIPISETNIHTFKPKI